MSSQSIFEKRITYFKNKCDIENLHVYFNIPHAKISFKFINSHDINTLSITYDVYENQDIIKYISSNNMGNRLPSDLTNEIIKYLHNHNYIYIQINLDFRENYPFHYPVWSLTDFKTNLNITFNECDKIVQSHNLEYVIYWSPSLQLEMDILSLYIKFEPLYSQLFNI